MGERVPTPTIGSNGDSLVVSFADLTVPELRSSGRLDLRRPGRVAQPVTPPPMRPRAVAPPLGDMAVGSMLLKNPSFVQASGPPVTLTLNNAPAKEALMSLARLGGYGFVFVADTRFEVGTPTASEYPITMSFRNESYERALNSVLMASGLQGRLDGETLLVGTAVFGKSFGPQLSKVFRLNQVDAESASRYLGNLGATIKIANTTTTTSRDSETSGTSSNSSESSTSTTTETSVVDTYGSGVGPLLGLVGTTDSRLNTITLVGEPSLVDVAQSYLKQIDLRKRQVAVKVQILNVNLDNDATIDSSFSAKIGDAFIVSESGKAHMNFGSYKPGAAGGGTGVYSGTGYMTPGMYPRDVNLAEKKRFFPPFLESTDANGNKTFSPHPDPNEPWVERALIDEAGKRIFEKEPYSVDRMQYQNSFYSYIESVVTSASAKALAQPTLLVQEGEKASVRSGESVITGVEREVSGEFVQFSNTREDAGLTLNLEVEKVDDNGFVTMRLEPIISLPVSAGQQNGVQIFNIVKRELNSGSIRLRDRQTLIYWCHSRI